MTTQELRELDAWIDLHLFGNATNFPLHYTTDKCCALDVLKKCAEKEMDNIVITNFEQWRVGIVDWDAECVKDYHIAPTLELAICLFAKQLFSQTTK